MQNRKSIKEAFPFIRQMISDVYGMDVHFFGEPYGDLNKIDRGFRQTVWKKDNLHAPLVKGLELLEGYHLFVVKSNLDFYNVIAFFCKQRPNVFISLGPFRDRPMTEQYLSRILSSNRLPVSHLMVIRQFYYSLPVVDMQNLLMTLQHLLSAFVPEFQHIVPETISFSEEQNTFQPDYETVQSFSGNTLENYASYLNHFLETLLTGNSQQSSDALKRFLDYIGYDANPSLNRMKKLLNAVNVHCSSRLLLTQIHPTFILEQYFRFEMQIENAGQCDVLLQLPYEMVRKYSLLVKNYSMPEYSYLVRNVMNYVTLHISEKLTLSVIAAYFQKNPSYLSEQFHKETGESLTEFIQKERMQTAIRYFNTTNMSVAEVAGNVGIHDFGYFSRLFKKHIGRTPSQYKKMVKS